MLTGVPDQVLQTTGPLGFLHVLMRHHASVDIRGVFWKFALVHANRNLVQY